MRWLDTKPDQNLSIVSHAAYDDTPSGVRDNSKSRFNSWRERVRFQQALIVRTCKEKGHLMTSTRCEWCNDPTAEDVYEPRDLCRMHEAEYEGLSMDALDHRDSEEAKDLQ